MSIRRSKSNMKEPMRKVLHLCLHFLLYIAIVGLFSLYVQEVENLVVGAVRVRGGNLITDSNRIKRELAQR